MVWKEVLSAYQVTGSMDYLLNIICADLVSYHQFLINKLGALPYIHSIKSMVNLKTIKEAGPLPIPDKLIKESSTDAH